MIFVTVGTHEQPFNRLLKKMDELVADGTIKEKVIIQTGFSTYHLQHCEAHKMIPFDKMQRIIKKARIVITHGGPSSFIEVLQFGKIPIVVPRQAKYHEHVNDHQVEFTRLIATRMKNIIPVYDIDQLTKRIKNYDQIIKGMNANNISNNKNFVNQFSKIVAKMM